MSVLSLAEVKTYLNISATTNDTEIQTFINRAEAAIANRVGPLAPTTCTEAHDGGSHLIRLLNSAVQSVTSLTESYGTYNRTLTEQPLDGSNGFTAYGFTLDRENIGGVQIGTGTIVRRVSGVAAPFASGRRNVTVVYVTGWSSDGTAATLPADLDELINAHIKDRWKSQLGGAARGGQQGPPPPDRFSPYVEELIGPFTQYGIS